MDKLTYKIFLLLIVLTLPFFADAQLFRSSNYWRQYRKEISFGIGASNTLTELGGRDRVGSDFIYDLELTKTKYSLSFAYRYFIKKNIAVRTSLFYAMVSGDDALTDDVARHNRNLNFKSPIVELSFVGEYHLINESAGHRYKLKGARGHKGTAIGMYTFVGLGLFYFDPRALDGTRLKPLHTEGQGLEGGPKQYSSINLAFPVGLGFRYSINTQWRISLQGGYRFTTTDYLDDVSTVGYNPDELEIAYGPQSPTYANRGLTKGWWGEGQQRGDPTDRDGYMFLQLQINYKILKRRKYGRGSRIKTRRSMPSF
ncbi:MAG: hypothetical protein JKY53_10560 [Flavobacteriales bacterium]|nr:hypothetical protein [Flavobacteriales bacterium]